MKNEGLEKLQDLKEKGILSDEEYLNEIAYLHKKEKESQNFMTSFTSMSPEEKRSKILFIMMLLGLFSVLAGIGLIIGSNWSLIPDIVKIVGGLVTFALSLSGTYYCHTKGRNILKELCLFISFFLIAGNIAIIQQVYNLDISWDEGSAIWWFTSLPLVFLSKRKYLASCSVFLFVFGTWEYLVDIFHFLNYNLIAGLLSIIVFISFLGGKKAKLIRNLAFCLAIITLCIGDLAHETIVSIVSTIIFLLFISTIPKTEEGQVKFCNCMLVFIAFRIFLLFCSAYHNLMGLGLQLIIFGGILLLISGAYYYYFDKIQSSFKKLVHHE